MTVSQLVKLPNVINLDTVEDYKKGEFIPSGKITKCDWHGSCWRLQICVSISTRDISEYVLKKEIWMNLKW